MKAKKIYAGILSVILVAGVYTSAIYAVENKNNEDMSKKEEISISEVKSSDSKDVATEKDETVYIMAGADGSVNDIIVSNHLKNTNGNAVLTDQSNLSDIRNVKGYEEFSQTGNSLVWSAGGNDIYYQGKSKEDSPIEINITYTLDDKEISPSEIAGKSGKVKIKIEYVNNLKVSAEINGKKEDIYVPFAIATGTVLNNKVFRNIEVSSGKLIDDGDKTIIASLAFPSIQENLAIDKEKIEIPEYLEITADVTNFEFNGFYAVAENNIFSNINLDGENTFDELKNSTNEMNSAMSQLMDGSSQLYIGINELNGKTKEFIEGISALSNGANQLSAGETALDKGFATLSDGIEQLGEGSNQLSEGLAELDKNSSALNDGANQIFATLLAQTKNQLVAQGIQVPDLTADNYSDILNGTAKQVEQLMGNGVSETIIDAKNKLDQIKSFCEGLNNYTSGVSSAYDGAKSVCSGAEQLSQGTEQLVSGISALKSGTDELSNGINILSEGGTKMANGISALADGACRLNDGLIKFNDEAIQKLVKAVDGDTNGLLEHINAMSEVAESYNNYSGISDGTKGSIKFIFRTDEIK